MTSVQNGGVMNHETLETMGKRKKPFTCDYTGFGWVLIKNGVFEHTEQMKYPWFAPKMQVFESGEVQDMCGEDVSFCLDAIEAGFRYLVRSTYSSRARENKSHLGGRYARSEFNRPI